MSTDGVDQLAAEILAVDGVVALHPADPWRVARVEQVPAPAVRLREGEVRVVVRMAVAEDAGAEATAVRVGEVLRTWCLTHHPALTPDVTVRVVTVEPA